MCLNVNWRVLYLDLRRTTQEMSPYSILRQGTFDKFISDMKAKINTAIAVSLKSRISKQMIPTCSLAEQGALQSELGDLEIYPCWTHRQC